MHPNNNSRDGILESCIKYPVTVSVVVLFVVFFGLRSLVSLPVQMTPDITSPVVSVNTLWPGASPAEVEREILERQEQFLKSLEGLEEMNATASPSTGNVVLEFKPDTNLDTALLKVNNLLNRVPGYPAEVERPIISTSGAFDNAIGWFIFLPIGDRVDPQISSKKIFVEDHIESAFERVPGVAAANIFGAQEQEVQILFSPQAMASRGLTVPQVVAKIRQEGKNYSAGKIDEGKRRYIVRTKTSFGSLSDIENILLREDPRDRVFLKDIAKVTIQSKDAVSQVRYKGRPCIAINAQRQVGSNVLKTMRGLQDTIKELNDGILKDNGYKLIQAYDSSIYIQKSLTLVSQNLLLGGLLAITVLLLFLRNARPTLIIACAIPISAVGTFLGMFLLGRNINVVSLAGISFAVGMLVDNSIVVLENIFSHLQRGKSPYSAAIDGTREVWGAIAASTITTVAVFLPLLFLDSEIAQLFKDIALAISCAVTLSLLVSVFVIPTLSANVLRQKSNASESHIFFANSLANCVLNLCSSKFKQIIVIATLSITSILFSYLLAPPAEYLPTGSRNLVFSILIPPPGYNLKEFIRIGEKLEGKLKYLWEGDKPEVSSFFYVATPTSVFMGFRSTEDHTVEGLMNKLRGTLNTVPGMIAIVVRSGLFNQGFGGGRTIDLRLTGPKLDQLMNNAKQAFFKIQGAIPGAQARPKPGLDLGQPELHILPNYKKLAEVGYSSRDIGQTVDALVDGVLVTEFRQSDGKIIDVSLRGKKEQISNTQSIKNLPLYLPNAKGVSELGSVVQVKHDMGPTQILRFEQERVVTLSITPPLDVPLQTAMKKIRDQIIEPMRQQGNLSGPYRAILAGTADKLTTTRKQLQGQFLSAILVTYLLLCALFQSFLTPLIILFSVPLAAFGGFLALRVVNITIASQPLDVLTMLGFIVLLGIVVNNAILIVDQTLKGMQSGQSKQTSVSRALMSRVRPIFMSTLTSMFGMAPLVLMTGPGSELYRGIGAVVLGGLLISTIFTLILIPAMCLLFLPDSKSTTT
ncbi:MAG: efflux RND transporter permease subunit [bacterium]|nr:efflux RND transporter permease subunit [bacterium]